MTVMTTDMAHYLGLTEAELMQQALQNFVQEKRREVLQIRLEIFARYQVESVAALEEAIALGRVPEHPAWEDLITIENLDTRLKELDAYLHEL